ncbi:Luciferin 4-monooxygenase [Halotydeus destructor]|nr:Luciferin 4-monooxygenase [Halotydeus destructor]
MPTELKYATVDEEGILRSRDAEPKVTLGSLQEFLYNGLTKDAERIVFIDHPSNRRWNEEQVLQMTLKIATALDNLGLSHGHRICTMLQNDDTHALWQFGIYMADSVFVGCYWTNPYRELLHYARVAQTSTIVCCKANLSIAMQVADELDSIKCLIYVDILEGSATRSTKGGKAIHSSFDVLQNIDKDLVLKKPLSLIGDPKEAAASIHFSSGSTGPRKAVIRTHYNYLAGLSDPKSTANDMVPPKGVMSCHNPIAHFSGGNTTLFGARNSAIVFNEGFHVTTFLEAVEKHKITAVALAPTAVNELIKSGLCGNYNLDSLNWVISAGAVVPDSVKKPGAQALGISALKQGYGSSEGGLITMCPAGLDNADTCGSPGRGVEIKLVDRETGNTLGVGQAGEAYVRSAYVTPGYFNNYEATAESFTRDGFFKTGDSLYYDEEGLFYVVDRYKDILKVGMSQVAPGELESLLLECDEVSEAAVIGIPDDHYGTIPKAFVSLKVSSSQNETLRQKLVQYVKENVSEWKTLKGGLQFIDHIPKISMGKMDKVYLRNLQAKS